jgi:hypothetical protein
MIIRFLDLNYFTNNNSIKLVCEVCINPAKNYFCGRIFQALHGFDLSCFKRINS